MANTLPKEETFMALSCALPEHLGKGTPHV